MTSPPRSARFVLALGVAVGLGTLAVLPATRPEQLGLATTVYTTAAEAALAGESFYTVAPPGLSGYHFVYPPVVALAFLPYGLLGDPTLSFAVQTAITVAAGLALAKLLLYVVGRAGVDVARVDRILVAAFVLLSVYTAPTLVNGQLNVVLGLLVAVGFVASERGRSLAGGVALAAAASVKLFPAAFGAYLLRRRDWRAIGAAVATGLGLAGLGLLVFGPDATVTYVTEVVSAETQTGTLADDPLAHDFVTVRRQLAALGPWIPTAWLPVLSVAVVAPVVALASRRVATREDRLLAVLATVIGTLLVLPLEALYFPFAFYPLVVLLYVLPGGRSRQLLVAGTVLTMVTVTPLGVASLVESGILGPALAAFVESVTTPLFHVVLPTTAGMWLLLAGAVHWQFRGRETPQGVRADGTDDSEADASAADA